MSETVELADGREVPSACTQALDNFDETIWPGATFPTARAAIAAAVIEAAEPYLRKKWAKEIIDELDTARATGKVYTYGEVQELIRNGVGK